MMRIRLIAVSILITMLGAAMVFGEQAAKRETDRDGRELKGPVRSVKIVTEVLEVADKNETDEGWIPSEITFDKFGNLETDVQFRPNGEIDERTSTEIDKAGNKIKETRFDAAGRIKLTIVYDHDDKGNITECKNIGEDGSVTGLSRFEFDKQGRNDSNISYNSDGTINTNTEVIYDASGERISEKSSTPEGGTTSIVDYKRMKKDGVETLETILRNGDGTLSGSYIESTDKNGDLTSQGFDADGKLGMKQTWEYTKKDDHGSWTVEIMTKWESDGGELILILKLKKKTVRTIVYF